MNKQFIRKPRSRAQALAFCKERYQDQCDKFPQTRQIPLSLYIARNLAGFMRGPWIEVPPADCELMPAAHVAGIGAQSRANTKDTPCPR